jgi:hypothetical protein
MKIIKSILFVTSLFFGLEIFAQDDLLNTLEKEAPKKKEIVYASFKGTRLINFQTVETMGKGSLDFRISHRFGDFSTGAYNFYGLDGPATLRLGFDYSVTDRFTVGVGRSSYQKMFDGFLKYRILRQTQDNSMPISVTGIVSMYITAQNDPTAAVTGYNQYEFFSSRMSYMYQLLIARKFNSRLTLQIAPTLIHFNLVTYANDKNDLFAIPISGRFKISKRFSITGEYGLRISRYTANQKSYYNSASIGVDIETGGHVFQLFITNSSAINEIQTIPYTDSNWSKGQVRIGFNISRVFSLSKKSKKK